MINKIFEKDLPGGIISELRGIDADGKSIISSLLVTAASMGMLRVNRNLNPGEEIELGIKATAFVICQNISREHTASVALMIGDKTASVIVPSSGIGYLQTGTEQILIYTKEVIGKVYIRNNSNVARTILACFITLTV